MSILIQNIPVSFQSHEIIVNNEAEQFKSNITRTVRSGLILSQIIILPILLVQVIEDLGIKIRLGFKLDI